MIEVVKMTSFEAVMRDPETQEQKRFNNLQDAIEAEKKGMKLVSCRGINLHK